MNESAQHKERINSTRKTKTQLESTYLMYCLLAEMRWLSKGNEKWVAYYREMARTIRARRRRAMGMSKVEVFDWRQALGIESRAEIIPQITNPPIAAVMTTPSY